jgi:hypothetical protein
MNTATHTLPAQRTLGAIVESAARLNEVSKADLYSGDCVQVTTRHSTYLIQVLEEGLYLISGGWVDLQGESPMKTTIAGCTWGGSAIKGDIVAACGLHLEFGKRVVTSTIQKVSVIRDTGNQLVH